jgi:hypothetical protein
MSQPVGNCPGCGGDEPFEQIHAGECPDTGSAECLEWACVSCGAAVFMGMVPDGAGVCGGRSREVVFPGSTSQSVRAA